MQDVPLQRAAHPYPVVIFSHGTCANRNTYSCICTRLAEEVNGLSPDSTLMRSWLRNASMRIAPMARATCTRSACLVLLRLIADWQLCKYCNQWQKNQLQEKLLA